MVRPFLCIIQYANHQCLWYWQILDGSRLHLIINLHGFGRMALYKLAFSRGRMCFPTGRDDRVRLLLLFVFPDIDSWQQYWKKLVFQCTGDQLWTDIYRLKLVDSISIRTVRGSCRGWWMLLAWGSSFQMMVFIIAFAYAPCMRMSPIRLVSSFTGDRNPIVIFYRFLIICRISRQNCA